MSSIKRDYRIQSNSIDVIGSILFGGKNEIVYKIDKHYLFVELEGIHSLNEF